MHKYYAEVCGWGSLAKDNGENACNENAEYSDNLHCMTLEICSMAICKKALPSGDYRRKLLCGRSIGKSLQIINSVITKKLNVHYRSRIINYLLNVSTKNFLSSPGSKSTFVLFFSLIIVYCTIREETGRLC